jgi:VWFA-related protein
MMSRPSQGYGLSLAMIAAAACGAICALVSAAQTLSPGEVRISGRAYQPQSNVLRAESELVRIDAVVRDGKGQIVSGLKPDDFTVLDDGKKQTVSSFVIATRQSHAPLRAAADTGSPAQASSQPEAQVARQRYVALYFDDLNTKYSHIQHVKVAAENFVLKGVVPEDQIAMFTSSGSETVDFTRNTREVLNAMGRLKFRGRTIESAGCPRITPYDAYLIDNRLDPETYDTILGEAWQCNCVDETNLEKDCRGQQEQIIKTQSKQIWESVRAMSTQTLTSIDKVINYLGTKPGERVLVLASSGFLTGTLETDVDNLVNAALRANVLINALDAKGLFTSMPENGELETQSLDMENAVTKHEAMSFGPSMTSLTGAMVDFAVGTGGRFFHNRNDLIAGYYSLAAAPETEYLLGFVPEESRRSGAFHKVRVVVNLPDKFDVQARPGYFAPKNEANGGAAKRQASPTPEEKIDAEVSGSDERSDFPVTVDEKPVVGNNGAKELSVQAHVDIAKLPFEEKQDRHVDMLTFVLALFDAQGKMVTGKEAQMQFALKPESYEYFLKSGINGGMVLEAPAGSYRLRVVVEEALHAEITTTSQNVKIE